MSTGSRRPRDPESEIEDFEPVKKSRQDVSFVEKLFESDGELPDNGRSKGQKGGSHRGGKDSRE